MASASEKLNRSNKYSESQLRCSICGEPFHMATTLACNHTFCEYCIEEWKRMGPARARHTCPMCRRVIRNQFRDYRPDEPIRQLVAGYDEESRADRERMLSERFGVITRRRDNPIEVRTVWAVRTRYRSILLRVMMTYLDGLITEMREAADSLLAQLEWLRMSWYERYEDFLNRISPGQ